MRTAITTRLGPPLLLFAITVGFFWKLTLTNQFTWMEDPDQAYQVVPWQQVQAQAFHQGELPLCRVRRSLEEEELRTS